MLWQKSTPVILYGAAYFGTLISNYLKDKSNIVAFLDKRADEIIQHKGIPVYLPENTPFGLEIKQNCIVIICVKNVFDHKAIAKLLLSQGFLHIITFENSIFNCLTTGKLELPVEIMAYQHSFLFKWKDEAIVKEFADRVIAKIPVPLIFTNKSVGEIRDRWENWPIQSLYPHLELFAYYNGNITNDTSAYVDEYCVDGAKRVGNMNTSERWKKNILESRQKIFANMDKHWQLQSSFFIDNAPTAEFRNGKFNLTSGKHRATFLVSKGAFFIPLNIAKEDYCTFLRMDRVQAVISYFENINLDETIQSIFHPYFYMYPSHTGFALYSVLRNFMPYLGKYFLGYGKKVSELKIYSHTINYTSLGRYFMQIGCSVNVSDRRSELDCLLDKLLIFNNQKRAIKASYDIAIFELELESAYESIKKVHSRAYIFFAQRGKVEAEGLPNNFILHKLFGFFDKEREYEIVLVMK